MFRGVYPIGQLTLTAQKPKGSAYPKELKTLGDYLRKRRLDLGLLQRDLAGRLGADEASVWNGEKNRNEPEIRFLPSILGFLGYDPRPAPRTIGERLVEHRKSRGWSQKRFAGELGVDPTTLARWERREREPGLPYQDRIARLLGS